MPHTQHPLFARLSDILEGSPMTPSSLSIFDVLIGLARTSLVPTIVLRMWKCRPSHHARFCGRVERPLRHCPCLRQCSTPAPCTSKILPPWGLATSVRPSRRDDSKSGTLPGRSLPIPLSHAEVLEPTSKERFDRAPSLSSGGVRLIAQSAVNGHLPSVRCLLYPEVERLDSGTSLP